MKAESPEKKVSNGILKTADRYLARLRKGERIMRDAAGKIKWADGKPIGNRTVRYLLEEGQIAELDTDLFGDRSRGQTLGILQ